ncbi:hypothetical protein RB195_019321 [Necator americanus]|uniref:SPRY domain protein n=1 Tax=Necator americanus TaxID=51031 RepID=A0ABR1CGG6_NECAM
MCSNSKKIGLIEEHCLSNTVMDWLRGRMFFGGGSSNASSADDEERRLVEQPSTSSTRKRSMMGAKQSAHGDNQGYEVSPVGETCPSRGASTSGVAAPGMPAPDDRSRSTVHYKLHSRGVPQRTLSPAHPHAAPCALDDMLRPAKFDYILNSQHLIDRQTQEMHAWNPDDRSLNIFVKDDDCFTFHRHPVAQSTDCIRGKMGYSSGFHVWQLEWPQRQRGTHAVVGVATKAAALHAMGYTSLIGTNTESYGWDLTRAECHHDSKNCSPWQYPTGVPMRPDNFPIPDKFYCILDMDDGYMAFATDQHYLGVAFRNLQGKTLYPIVSAVWGHCEITMKYLGGIEPSPRPLMDICRRAIRVELGRHRLHRVDELRLPPPLKRFILYRK